MPPVRPSRHCAFVTGDLPRLTRSAERAVEWNGLSKPTDSAARELTTKSMRKRRHSRPESGPPRSRRRRKVVLSATVLHVDNISAERREPPPSGVGRERAERKNMPWRGEVKPDAYWGGR